MDQQSFVIQVVENVATCANRVETGNVSLERRRRMRASSINALFSRLPIRFFESGFEGILSDVFMWGPIRSLYAV